MDELDAKREQRTDVETELKKMNIQKSIDSLDGLWRDEKAEILHRHRQPNGSIVVPTRFSRSLRPLAVGGFLAIISGLFFKNSEFDTILMTAAVALGVVAALQLAKGVYLAVTDSRDRARYDEANGKHLEKRRALESKLEKLDSAL